MTVSLSATIGLAPSATTPSSTYLIQAPTNSDYNSAVPAPIAFYCHGSGETESTNVSDTNEHSVVAALLGAGFYVMSSLEHGDNWGNQSSLDDLVQDWSYVRSQYRLRNSLFMAGQSMGGLAALTVIAQRKVPINGCGLIYPCTNLGYLYANIPAIATAVNTAFSCTSGTYSTATSGYDPQLRSASEYAACTRWRMYASSGDTTVSKTNNSDPFSTKVAGNSPAENNVVACTGNHGDASHFQPSDFLSFAQRCVAG